jgi:hypothetical protein
MAGITQAQAQAQLNAYLAAETAVLTGQAYTINGRSLTRADLAAIQKGIEIWQARLQTISRGGFRLRGVTPV